MAAAFVLLRLNERTRIKGDAAIAMFSTTAVAIGAIVISMTKGMGRSATTSLARYSRSPARM